MTLRKIDKDMIDPSFKQEIDTEISNQINVLKEEVSTDYSTKTELENHSNKIASTTQLGHIKPDGETIKVDPETGVASVVSGGSPIVNAVSTDGETYNVSLTGVTELTKGLQFTISPNMVNTASVKISVNELASAYLTYGATGLINVGLLHTNGYYNVVYNGQFFVLVGDGFGLVDSFTSTSKNYAATANAVKQVNDLKANKIQGNSLVPTGNASWDLSNSRYFKDEFGIVHFFLNAVVGQKTEATFITTGLPVGYRPQMNGVVQPFNIISSGTATIYPNVMTISTGGDMYIGASIPSNGTMAYGYFSFRTQ